MFKTLLTAILASLIVSTAHADVSFWKHVWKQTDFSKSSIDFRSVLSGGPGKDGIPAIDKPVMVPTHKVNSLSPKEPVMTVEMRGHKARAYPIRYLMWHEIANDRIGKTPVAVTFCPLCNSGVVFDRRVGQEAISLGVSGKLRNSDMIMYDRQTESWWQQFTGEAIVGEMLGQKLKKIPSWMESWQSFKSRNPDGLVLEQPRLNRAYGQNPYVGYDTGRPFLYNGENPPHGINPMERVVVIDNMAWPLQRFKSVNKISEKGFTITWDSGTASALDSAQIATGRDVGTIRVKDRSGNDVVHDVAFAFAFHAFHPNGTWMRGN